MKKAESILQNPQEFIDAIRLDHGIRDIAGLGVLRQIRMCLERIDLAQEVITREGLTQADKYGRSKCHPATVLETRARTEFCALMRLLALDPNALNGSHYAK